MTITIPGYTIELDYFPGTPGDQWTAPTEDDFEILSVVDWEGFSFDPEVFGMEHEWQIMEAIHANLEEEAAQSKFEEDEYKLGENHEHR